jgi:serine/threonine-protein kinase
MDAAFPPSEGQRRAGIPPSNPRRIGKYRVVTELGRGGTANVYLAMARGPGGVSKLVVLKALLPDLADEPSAVASFLDEARLAALLNHPNVVQTYEVGSEGDRDVIVMEYLEGQSLSRIVRLGNLTNRRLPETMHLRILIEALEGLHYAHELRGYDGAELSIVHRDVSPQNVLVTYEGQVKVLDFGIAKAATTSTQTAAGLMKGKIAYMSPEQMSGAPVDRRADIFSMGCMLWAAATGQKLWKDEGDANVVRKVLGGSIPSPRSLNPGCSDELERIVMKALELEPDRRYSTAQELQEDLERVAERSHGVRGRDIGRFVSNLFADARAEVKLGIERELSALSTTDTYTPPQSSRDQQPGSAGGFQHTIRPEIPTRTGAPLFAAPQRLRSGAMAALGVLLLGLTALGGLYLANRNAAQNSGFGPSSIVSQVPAALATLATATPVSSGPMRIQFQVQPPGAQLVLDGSPLAPGVTEVLLPLDGVQHRLEVSARGYEPATRQFAVAGPERFQVELEPKAALKSPAPAGSVRVKRAAPAEAAASAAIGSVSAQAEPAAVVAPDCESPFFVDQQGIRRVRSECL